MYVKLLATKEAKEKESKKIEEIEDINKSSTVDISKKERERIVDFVFTYYDEWETSTANDRQKLIKYNEILEGNLPKTDFPFGIEHSSQIDLKLAAGQFRAFRTLFRSSVFNNPNLFVAQADTLRYDRTKLTRMEKAIYWHAKEKSNLIEILKDTDLPAFRDGSALVSGSWVRKIESGIDYKTYINSHDFKFDYPDNTSAGITESKYSEIIEFLSNPNSRENLQVEYDIDFVKKDGIEFKLFPKANFVYYPFFADNVSDLIIYGYLYKETVQEIKSKIRSGFYSKDTKDIISKDEEKSESIYPVDNEWDKSVDDVEGISTDNNDIVEIAKLNVSIDLNEDDIPEKYTIYWHNETKTILRIEKYRIRKNIPDIACFKFISREGRLCGISLLDGVSDLLLEVNALHRHRSNVRRLTDSPTIMFPDKMKQTISRHEFKPGSPIWIPDQLFQLGRLPQQFVIQNLDNSRTSIDEETMILKYTETLLGPTQGLSGQIDPSDPSAPGNKTAMLLNQANARVQDYIEEWKRTIPIVLDLLIALTFQNSKAKLEFIERVGEKETPGEIDIEDFIGDDVKFSLSANSAGIAPELEMGKAQAIAASAINMGVAKLYPHILVETFNAYVAASKISGFEKMMVTGVDSNEVGQQMLNTGGNAEATQQNVVNGIPLMPGTKQE